MKIEITETFQRTVDMPDNEIIEAIASARKQYKDGKVVLGDEDFVGASIDVFPSVQTGKICRDTDIKSVIEYLWKDEKRNWEESNYPKEHIFHTLRRLKEKYE